LLVPVCATAPTRAVAVDEPNRAPPRLPTPNLTGSSPTSTFAERSLIARSTDRCYDRFCSEMVAMTSAGAEIRASYERVLATEPDGQW